ncbi:hypothetical protein [Paludibaculum fermentans]|uniref:hypothetical protein n=1 Tax=Paludibaculum fermentans TaxID=1473598 RepID=UPI003EB9FA26
MHFANQLLNAARHRLGFSSPHLASGVDATPHSIPGIRTPGARLVWNKGIAALCDWRCPDEFPPGQGYTTAPVLAGAAPTWRTPKNLIPNPSACAGLPDGAVIWLRLSWIGSFLHQVLPLIRSQFILVTADSDSPVPSSIPREARTLVHDSRLIHWYAQNYDGSGSHGKISPAPIGIDYHTLCDRPYWGEAIATPAGQEQSLLSIRETLPPLSERIPSVYVDFGWQRTRLGGRRDLIRHLRGNPRVYLQEQPLGRSEMWRRRGRYAFVLSPPGNGLDTHRLWESLALGHIVLTPASSLDPLFQDLPVVPFRHWSEIQPGHLDRCLAALGQSGTALPPQLTSEYWITRIRTGQPIR